MKKYTYYTYLGTNGTINTLIHLPGVYNVKSYKLEADEGKKLTKDGITFVDTVRVSQTEVDEWYEVEA